MRGPRLQACGESRPVAKRVKRRPVHSFNEGRSRVPRAPPVGIYSPQNLTAQDNFENGMGCFNKASRCYGTYTKPWQFRTTKPEKSKALKPSKGRANLQTKKESTLPKASRC